MTGNNNPRPGGAGACLPGRTVARCLQYALDLCLFAQEALAFTPDATQSRVLRDNAHRSILNCNRQWGKSTLSAIRLAHRAIFLPGSLSLILAPSERQSAETLRKVRTFLNKLELPIARDGANRHSIVLPDCGDSRIVALPSSDDTVRGFSAVSLLVVDEASRVADPLYNALVPSLAVSRGDITLISTPFGKRGFFYNEFTNNAPTPAWKRYTVPASQCPRIDPAFLEEERASKGEEYFDQEYECQFVEDGRFLFSDADFKRLFKSDVKPIEVNRNDPAWSCVMKPVKPQPPTEWPNIYAREE